MPGPGFKNLLRSTTGTGGANNPPTSQRPIQKSPPKPPPTEIEESESEFKDSMPQNLDEMGSESASESDLDPDPVPARKKAPKTRSKR